MAAEFDEQLITSVQQYPFLNNIKFADFKVALKKEKAWTTIANNLKSSGKWNGLQ